ncbi:MAG: hypothetical protein Fur0027_08750 [Raineya sp.]
MKNILFLILCLCVPIISVAQAPNPNSVNILFLEYNLSNNGEAYSQLILKADRIDKEWKKCYLFSSEDSRQKPIERQFYVPNENVFWYVNPAAYEAVLKDNNQIRNILDGKRYPEQTEYFRGFSKIYLLDLEQANPNNPNEFKLIEVKPYLPWEH